jgi:GWxTD domain-containing protein
MGTVPVSAQDDAVPAAVSEASQRLLEEGIEAFRDDRFDVAKAAFERAIDKDGANAEAYYMLSRVYYETPLFDKGEAGRSIRQARKLDPDNIEYMVAELQQLRLPSWNNLAELIQQQQRRAIAEQILSVDSTNAFAHEELGASFIRDFWQYRNAIALPTLDLARSELNRTDDPELGFEGEGQIGSQTLFEDPEAVSSLETNAAFGDADAIDLTDRFDVAKLQAQGAGVLDLSSRADAAYAAAIGHLEKALQYDPRRRPVYDHLMRIHTLNEAYADALGVLERMYIFFPEDPQTWAYLGLANQRSGRSDAAAKSFEEAFKFMDAEERADFEDLTLILNDEDRERYAEDPVGFASRFWTSQNPRYLTSFNERKLEHFARLVHADLLYAAPEIDLRGWQTQRGRLVVRYGPPLSDVTMTGDFGEVISGFGLNVAAQDVESGRQFGERFDMADRSNLFNVWDYGDFKFVFEDPLRNGEYRLYSPPADFFADVSAGFVEKMDYEMIARETFRETPERYEYRPPGRDVRIPYVVTAFKGEGGQADLYVHYGIPLGAGADLSGDLVPLTVKTGAFLINDDRDITVERRRTLYGLKTSQVVSFEEATLWTDTQPMTAAPGPATVSVEFETAGGGAEAAQRRAVDVPDFGGDRLAVSDLMLAYQVEDDYEAGDDGVSGGRVRRGDVVIQPAPWSVFSNEQPIYLYFETYNLDENAEGQNQYAVEVTLKPKDTSGGIARLAKRVFGGDDGGVSVEFEAGGTGPDDATYTILDAAGQEPGLYTLTLRVRDTLTGRTAERTSDLYLE